LLPDFVTQLLGCTARDSSEKHMFLVSLDPRPISRDQSDLEEEEIRQGNHFYFRLLLVPTTHNKWTPHAAVGAAASARLGCRLNY